MALMKLFKELKVGEHFRIPGYDDLFRKTYEHQAIDCGCGWLKKPVRFGRCGSTFVFEDEEMVTPS